MKKLIIANCPEKFKIFDFANFSRIPLCSSEFIFTSIETIEDFEFNGIRENVISLRSNIFGRK